MDELTGSVERLRACESADSLMEQSEDRAVSEEFSKAGSSLVRRTLWGIVWGS